MKMQILLDRLKRHNVKAKLADAPNFQDEFLEIENPQGVWDIVHCEIVERSMLAYESEIKDKSCKYIDYLYERVLGGST